MSTASLTVQAQRPLNASAIALMMLCCLSWGFNQVAIKLVLPDVPPLMQATIRSVGAIVVIFIVAQLRGVKLFERDGTLRAGLFAGLLFGIEFVLIYRGLIYTSATRAVVFLYTAPFFVALGASRFLGERLTAVQWSGLALCFLGVALAIGVPQADVDGRVLLGDLLVVGGGALWAATTLLAKSTRLITAPAEKVLGYQVAISIPILAGASWIAGETVTHVPSALSVSLLTYQAVWVVGMTFMLWFSLVKTYSASKLSAFSFMTPLFGVAGGYFVMHDPLSPAFALAAVFVIGGLYLVNRPGRPAIDPLLQTVKT